LEEADVRAEIGDVEHETFLLGKVRICGVRRGETLIAAVRVGRWGRGVGCAAVQTECKVVRDIHHSNFGINGHF
jgi:hypothetical protein